MIDVFHNEQARGRRLRYPTARDGGQLIGYKFFLLYSVLNKDGVIICNLRQKEAKRRLVL